MKKSLKFSTLFILATSQLLFLGLLDLQDPRHILEITDQTLLEIFMEYERHGLVPNVVFPCGAVLLQGYVYLYYGCGDGVTSVAKMELEQILALFRQRN